MSLMLKFFFKDCISSLCTDKLIGMLSFVSTVVIILKFNLYSNKLNKKYNTNGCFYLLFRNKVFKVQGIINLIY